MTYDTLYWQGRVRGTGFPRPMCHNEASTEEKHIPYRTYSHYFAYKFVHLWNSNYFSAQIKASITFFSVHVTNS